MTQERKLYKIGHLTKLLGLTSRTIRYYDQIGLLPHVKRSDGGIRLFDENDVQVIKKIRRMQTEEYMPLDIIKERLFGKGPQVETTQAIVLTDSTACLPAQIRQNLPIDIIPLKILVEDEEYLDGVNISPNEFWEKCKSLLIQPKIQPPSEKEFIDTYLKHYKQGVKRIYSVHLTSKIANVCDIARSAAHKVADKVDVQVIDSRSAGSGLGLFVQQIAEAIDKKESSEKVDLLIAKQLPLIFYTAVANTLKYLITGGIFKNTPTPEDSFLGKLFEFKPVIAINSNTGEIDVLECCKTKEDAINLIVEKIEEEYVTRGNHLRQIVINYNFLYAEAMDLINTLKQKFPNTAIYMEESSPVLSIYLGPETLSIAAI